MSDNNRGQEDRAYPDPTAEAVGGGLRATIDGIAYEEILKVFGQPNSFNLDPDKVDVEWLLRTPAGPATLYNWKPELPPGISIADVANWHIGGLVDEVVPYVMNALGTHARLNCRIPAWRSSPR